MISNYVDIRSWVVWLAGQVEKLEIRGSRPVAGNQKRHKWMIKMI